MASNNFYPANAQRAPPAPPPRQTNATVTKKVPRPRQTTYKSNRATATAEVTGNDNVNNDANTSAPATAPAVRTVRKPYMSGVKKTPAVASRPVGSYYNTSTETPTPIARTDAPDNNNNNNSNWNDWSEGGTSAPTTTAAGNKHSSWASSNNDSASIPAPTATTTTTTNSDWYSASGSTTTTSSVGTAPAMSMYKGPGYNNTNGTQSQQQSIGPGNGFYQNSMQDQQQQPFLSGAMDSSAPTMMAMNSNNNDINNTSSTGSNSMPSFSMFMPAASTQQQDAGMYPSPEDEAPLLEELGINIQHIILKTKAVVFPFSRLGGTEIDPIAICQDGDLPGPVALLLLLGGEMVLAGKLQFGFIYVYGLFGCIAMTLVVNLMSPTDAVSFWTVTSIMGYSLLPVNILALVKIVIMNLIHLNTFGNILGCLAVLWSTLASTRLLELGCSLRDQRYLIAYPLLLFYSAFVMMTIF